MPPPKDPQKLILWKERLRLARIGKPSNNKRRETKVIPKKILKKDIPKSFHEKPRRRGPNKNPSSLRGKTYREIYGEKAEEQKIKLRKPKSEAHRKKISKTLTGRPSPKSKTSEYGKFWKGKIRGKWTEEEKTRRGKNKKGRGSMEYAVWRKAVIERDISCQGEGPHRGKLHAHHLKSWENFPELRFIVTNGKALCSLCHKRLHAQYAIELKKSARKLVEVTKKLVEGISIPKSEVEEVINEVEKFNI